MPSELKSAIMKLKFKAGDLKMTIEQMQAILARIQVLKAETQNMEYKTAAKGEPHKLYDTISSFSNQDEGGIIIFGVDEKHNFEEVGVGDVNALQNSISNQCLEMEPRVRPLISHFHRGEDEKDFLFVEIPGLDISLRPCYYRGKGQIKGSYVRVGDHDEPMTAYEVYSYEAFRRRTYDELRVVERASKSDLDLKLVNNYLEIAKANKPNFSTFSDAKVANLLGVFDDEHPTLCSLLVFSPYPQVYYPQLCVIAIKIAGTEIGDLAEDGQRFIDNKRIEGNLQQVLEGALRFVRTNMKVGMKIDATTGVHVDQPEYPIMAIREAILNALVHRDYSMHTEGTPIQLTMFNDRLEIRNPGGLYGRITVDNLGKMRTDTRNPVLATMLEYLHITENRYSGIPIMRKQCQELGISAPVFKDNRGEFYVTFYNKKVAHSLISPQDLSAVELSIIKLCQKPRSKKELAAALGLSSVQYAFNVYVKPMIDKGLIKLDANESPNSRKQKFIANIKA